MMAPKITAPDSLTGERSGIEFTDGVAEIGSLDDAARAVLVDHGFKIEGANAPTEAEKAAEAKRLEDEEAARQKDAADAEQKRLADEAEATKQREAAEAEAKRLAAEKAEAEKAEAAKKQPPKK